MKVLDDVNALIHGSKVTILVHGTFSRHAAWTREGMLHQNLLDLGHVVRFCWSGRNRVRDRLEAGSSLRHLILKIADQRPDLTIAIVAHSHGGNVALYALDPDGLDINSQAILEDVHIVTLSTPFLFATPQYLPRPAQLIGATLGCFGLMGLVLFSTIVVMFAYFLTTEGFPNFSESTTSGSTATPLGDALGISYIMIVGLQVASIIWSWAYTSRRADAAYPWHWLSPHVIKSECIRVSSPNNLTGDRLLVLRARGDEASGALAAGSIAAWISHLLIERIRAWHFWAILAALLALSFAGQNGATRPGMSDTAQTIANLLGYVLAALVLAVCLALSVRFACCQAFGMDLTALALVAHFDVESAPGSDVAVTYVDPYSFRTTTRLRHKLYEEPGAIRAASEFLTPGPRDGQEGRRYREIGQRLLGPAEVDPTNARDAFTRAIHCGDRSPETWTGRAWSNLQIPGKHRDAALDASRALLMQSDIFEALTVRALALISAPRLAQGQAVADGARLIQLRPESAIPYSISAAAWINKDPDNPLGIESAVAALTIAPSDTLARYAYCEGSYHSGDLSLDVAEQTIRELLLVPHNYPMIWRFAAFLALQRQPPRFADGVLAATRALEISGSDALASLYRSELRATAERPDYASALDDVNVAIALEPEMASAYLLRARILARLEFRRRIVAADIAVATSLDKSLGSRESLIREICPSRWQQFTRRMKIYIQNHAARVGLG